MSKDKTGFNCTTCRKRHDYPGYVAAHWNEVVTHTCDCGAKHDILRGRATQIKKGKAPSKETPA